MNYMISRQFTEQDYEPDDEETRQQEAVEQKQKECKHSHKWEDLDPEDGCVHCGFYAK